MKNDWNSFFTLSGLTVFLMKLIEKITKIIQYKNLNLKKKLSQFFSFLAYDFIKYMHSVSFCQKINIEWNWVIHSSYSLKNYLKNTFLKYLLKFMRKLFYQHSIFHFVFLTYIKSGFIFLGSYSLIFTYFCYLPLFCSMWSFNHNNQVLM